MQDELLHNGDFGELFVAGGAAFHASEDEDNHASTRQRVRLQFAGTRLHGSLKNLSPARMFRERGWMVGFAATTLVMVALLLARGARMEEAFVPKQRVVTPAGVTAPVRDWMDQVD